ncbi:hypothetical protein FB451DRAFT_1375400 [Mycena latifolia]|nr:hypothetical protein FB451DRAFT_1375400 [Mycena latifolia]
MTTVPDDVCSEILAYSSTRTLCNFARASKNSCNIVRGLLYRNVSVGYYQAVKLFNTLEVNPSLGSEVRDLTLTGGRIGIHRGPAFQAALTSMTRLISLRLKCALDTTILVSSCHAPLKVFLYSFTVCDEVFDFLKRQNDITFLSFEDDFHRKITPRFLPRLEHLHARPKDLLRLVPGHPIKHLSVAYRDEDKRQRPTIDPAIFQQTTTKLVTLEVSECQLDSADYLDNFIPDVKSMRIWGDSCWGNRRATPDFAQRIDAFTRKLASLKKLRRLIIHTSLSDKHAKMFFDAMYENCDPPKPTELAFHTLKKCFFWEDYGDPACRAVVCAVQECRVH